MRSIDFGFGSPDELEKVIQAEIGKYLSRAWRPNSNHDGLAFSLGVLCKSLKSAGYDVDEVHRQWRAAYEAYKLDGGRAKWREIHY